MKWDEVETGQRVEWLAGEAGTVLGADDDWVTVRLDAAGKIPSTVEEIDVAELTLIEEEVA